MTGEDPAFTDIRDAIAEQGIDQVRAEIEAWTRAGGPRTCMIGDLIEAARYWVEEIEPSPRTVLTVRCREDRRGAPCGEVMARYWRTPLGHYGLNRQAPSHAVNMSDLSLAVQARADGNHVLSALAESIAGKPAWIGTVLEHRTHPNVPLGCHSYHGYMTVRTETILTECRSTRQTLNLYPTRWRARLE